MLIDKYFPSGTFQAQHEQLRLLYTSPTQTKHELDKRFHTQK